jgi:hypothetical protein
MPMFAIETYKVTSYLQRFPGETRPSRLLEITGPILFHGIQNRAFFSFDPSFDGVWSNPVVGYLTDGGFAGLSVAGWFPLAEYSYYYDILRSEKPVNVIYEFRDPGVTSGYLRRLGLGTSTEQIGEGPSDSTESISTALLRQLDLRRELIPLPTRQDLPKREK